MLVSTFWIISRIPASASAAVFLEEFRFFLEMEENDFYPLFTEQVVWVPSALGRTRASDRERRARIAALRIFGMMKVLDEGAFM